MRGSTATASRVYELRGKRPFKGASIINLFYTYFPLYLSDHVPEEEIPSDESELDISIVVIKVTLMSKNL